MHNLIKMPSSLKIDPYDENLLHNNSRGSSLDKSESSAESNAALDRAGSVGSSAGSSAVSSAGSSGNNINMKISDKVEEELSQLWDSGQEWILIFDNLLKHPGGKVGKGCKCDMCEMQKPNRCYNNEVPYESFKNSGNYQFSQKNLSNNSVKKLSKNIL